MEKDVDWTHADFAGLEPQPLLPLDPPFDD